MTGPRTPGKRSHIFRFTNSPPTSRRHRRCLADSIPQELKRSPIEHRQQRLIPKTCCRAWRLGGKRKSPLGRERGRNALLDLAAREMAYGRVNSNESRRQWFLRFAVRARFPASQTRPARTYEAAATSIRSSRRTLEKLKVRREGEGHKCFGPGFRHEGGNNLTLEAIGNWRAPPPTELTITVLIHADEEVGSFHRDHRSRAARNKYVLCPSGRPTTPSSRVVVTRSQRFHRKEGQTES